jgi:2'-5' RNA ligase
MAKGDLFYGFHVNSTSVQSSVRDFVADMQESVPRATWTTPEKLHVTVLFLGNVPEQGASDRLQRACSGKAPFFIKVQGAGYFTNRGGPRVLYAVVGHGGKLLDLHTDLGGKGAYTAHLTLAKLEDKGDFEPSFKAISDSLSDHSFGSALVSGITLYRTVGGGKPYEVVAEHRLVA